MDLNPGAHVGKQQQMQQAGVSPLTNRAVQPRVRVAHNTQSSGSRKNEFAAFRELDLKSRTTVADV